MNRWTMARISPNALTVLRRRYLMKNAAGRVTETPARMFQRVADDVAEAERLFHPAGSPNSVSQNFSRLMAGLEFLPNSPALMNAGRELEQLCACFVLPVQDSLRSIFEAVKQTALIHQSGGGTGFSFSRLRPKDDRVRSTGGIASGPVSFIKVFNMATDVIRQGGTRRGANMGVLAADHPDILEFIAVKENPAELNNFNLSVAVTDGFMRAAVQGKRYPLLHPRTRKAVRKINATEVFDRIVRAAWATGEPGLLFLDRINRDNPTPALGALEATNPCGEQPLLPYESCTLGSINLTKMVRGRMGGAKPDTAKLRRTIHTAVRFLDDVVERTRSPIPEINEISRGNRKIGLGIMGWADFLILQGIPYDSEEALQTAERLMAFIQEEARRASAELAKERGVFPNFEKSVFFPNGPRLRNATVTTIAPTGTLSLIAGCSSGVEPLYAIATARAALENVTLKEVHPLFIRFARRAGIYSDRLLKRLGRSESIQGDPRIPSDLQNLFVTAHDIPPEFHIRMQAAFQRHTDNAVSKTVNFPKTAKPGEVRRAFLSAHREGCKGITIYRSGSREGQVLTCAEIPYC